MTLFGNEVDACCGPEASCVFIGRLPEGVEEQACCEECTWLNLGSWASLTSGTEERTSKSGISLSDSSAEGVSRREERACQRLPWQEHKGG